jgi:Protein of unknown function (DUF3775)
MPRSAPPGHAAWEVAMLTISLDRLIDLLDKAAEVDVPETEAADNFGEAARFDAEEIETILADDPAYGELVQAVRQLTPEESEEVLALALLGRNAASLDEWQVLIEEARGASTEERAEALLRALLLTDELETALERLGYLAEEDEDEEDEDEEEEEEEEEEETSGDDETERR